MGHDGNHKLRVVVQSLVLKNVSFWQRWRRKHREQICGHGVERERGTQWGSSVETSTLPYIKQPASGGLLCGTGSSPLCWEWWDGLGGAREVQEGGDIGIPVTDSWWYMGKTRTIL